MMASKCFFLAFSAAMVGTGEATAFLKATPSHPSERMSAQDVQTSLLEEIEGSLGSGIAAKRINDMKAILGPMFTSLPKNEQGNLDHVTVRYALHRAFTQAHGWAISGLDPAGGAWNSSSPASLLKNQVPSYIQNLFEQRLGGRGLGVHEMAVFAATIEHLIHNEAAGRLGAALTVHELSPMDVLTIEEVDEVLDAYMMAYILQEDISKLSLRKVNVLVRGMHKNFVGWHKTQMFVSGVRDEIARATGKNTADKAGKQFDFATLVKIAETVSERFGKFQDGDCKDIKSELMKMEDRGSGRVRLSDFYRPALMGESWHFMEGVAYMRQLGVLDESNADEPRVMIANYIAAETNCIGGSDFYTVCCIDECEDLVGHLEKEIAQPEATAARIAELISALPSSTVSAPRALSATLRTRLDDIAEHHGGLVQFHGRLFAQWMHHAYPRECPYPHMSSTTSREQMDWQDRDTVRESVVTKKEMVQFTTVANSTGFPELEGVNDMHDLMMWSHEEELLFPHVKRVPASMSFMARLRNIMLLAAMAYAIVGVVRTAAPKAAGKEKSEKFMV